MTSPLCAENRLKQLEETVEALRKLVTVSALTITGLQKQIDALSIKSRSNIVGCPNRFITEHFVFNPDAKTGICTIYDAYWQYCSEQDLHPETLPAFVHILNGLHLPIPTSNGLSYNLSLKE